MSKITADSIPTLKITRDVEHESETPSISRFTVDMFANDWAMQDDEVATEHFARATIVLFEPNKGNPTDDADAESQELFDVATAFYDPDGDSSARALEKGVDESMGSPPLAYIENIDLLEGYEKGGRLDAGLAMALAQIAKDTGCDYVDGSIMVAAYENRTLHVVAGADLDGAAKKGKKLSKELKDALRLGAWVKEGETFATEPSHGAAQGLVLGEAANQMMGYGSRLGGNTLLGVASFDHGIEFDRRARTDAQEEQWLQSRYKALGCDAEGMPLDQGAKGPAAASLADEAKALGQRFSALLASGDIKPEDLAEMRSMALQVFSALPIESDIGGKIQKKRSVAIEASAAEPGKPKSK